MSSKINRYTIIIPEHNRPDHLKRLLDYFLSFDLKIIVVDSSNIKFKYLDEYKYKINYEFFPKLDLASKLYKIKDLIDTPYVVMCANDDFLVPNSIDTIINFLEDNSSYNSGQGIYLDFTYNKYEIVYSTRYKNTIDIDLKSQNSSQRVLDLQSNYFQYYYAVFRTNVFIRSISSVIVNDSSLIRNLCLLESYISIYAAIDGKHRIFPIFYSVRENIENSAGSFTDNLFDITRKNKYRDEYSSYLKLLSEYLSLKESISYKKAYNIINESVNIYLKKSFPNYLGRIGTLKYTLSIIFKYLKIRRFSFGNNTISNIPDFFTDSDYDRLRYIEKYIVKFDYIYKQE